MADIQNYLFFKYKDEIKNLNGPKNVEFSYLSFDIGLSSENAITTTFSQKKLIFAS